MSRPRFRFRNRSSSGESRLRLSSAAADFSAEIGRDSKRAHPETPKHTTSRAPTRVGRAACLAVAASRRQVRKPAEPELKLTNRIGLISRIRKLRFASLATRAVFQSRRDCVPPAQGWHALSETFRDGLISSTVPKTAPLARADARKSGPTLGNPSQHPATLKGLRRPATEIFTKSGDFRLSASGHFSGAFGEKVRTDPAPRILRTERGQPCPRKTKAAEDSRTPKPRGNTQDDRPCASFWSAAVLCRCLPLPISRRH